MQSQAAKFHVRVNDRVTEALRRKQLSGGREVSYPENTSKPGKNILGRRFSIKEQAIITGGLQKASYSVSLNRGEGGTGLQG